MMQTFIFVIVILFAVDHSLGRLSEEKVDREYHAQLTRKGAADILKVKNSAGEVVVTIDVYPNDGYQIVKPNDEDDVCLIKHLHEEDGQEHQCYDRVPWRRDDDDEGLEEQIAKCGYREVFLLKPRECDDRGFNTRLSEPRPPLPPGCYLKEEYVVKCIREESYCTKKGWLWRGCKSWGLRCAEYGTELVITTYCE